MTLMGPEARAFDGQYPLGSRKGTKHLPKASDWRQTGRFMKQILSKGLLWPYASRRGNRDTNKTCSLS